MSASVLHYRGSTSGSNPTGITEVSATNPLPVSTSGGSGGTQSKASTTSSTGTQAVDTTVGGTQVVAAQANRYFTQCQNRGSVTVYYGAGTVTSSYQPVDAGDTFTWHSQEALKVLSSSGSVNITYTDYINS